MSDTNPASKDGPALQETVHEVQGRFPNDAAMQDALGRLTLAGFDRADLSLPNEHGEEAAGTPNEAAQVATDHIDKTQLRTMGTSMAAYAGAAAITGATIATGGAAGLAVAAAAAVGLGSGLAANAIGQAAEASSSADRDRLGAEGRLVLAVRTRSPDDVAQATTAMHQAGATDVRPVTRGTEALTAGISSTSWTGA